MRWIKLFCLLSVLFISAVIFVSQPTYATSFDFTPTPDTTYSINDLGLSFTPHYIKYTVSSSNFSFSRFFIETSDNQTSNNPFNSNFDNTILIDNYSPFGNPATSYSGVISIPYYPNLTPVFRFRRQNTSLSYDVTFTFLDTLECPECPDCPDVPEIPDDSQTLLDIKKAIYTIPAVLLVIYFFYIMFGWYLGGRS